VDWLKLSVDLPDHPKVAELSDRAKWVLISAWCYVARFELQEGHVPDAAARNLGLNNKIASELEAAGLLHRNGSGWHIHDWDDHQSQIDELADIRRKARERKAAERRRRKESPSHEG
jgi:hypothetical protein